MALPKGKYDDEGPWKFIFYGFATFVLFAIYCRGMVLPDKDCEDALFARGYHNIHIEDRSGFFPGAQGCEGLDAAIFLVQATDLSNTRVNLKVCGGMGKPYRIERIDLRGE
jgi:hypothetical protein